MEAQDGALPKYTALLMMSINSFLSKADNFRPKDDISGVSGTTGSLGLGAAAALFLAREAFDFLAGDGADSIKDGRVGTETDAEADEEAD